MFLVHQRSFKSQPTPPGPSKCSTLCPSRSKYWIQRGPGALVLLAVSLTIGCSARPDVVREPSGSETPAVASLDGESLVQVEGYGKVIRLDAMAYAAEVGKAAGPNALPSDLLVSSEATGSLATAYVSSSAPLDTAARRPIGLVRNAGINSIAAGPNGDWHVRFRDVSFRWPDSTILLVVPDNHPGNQLPLFLVEEVTSDELVALYAGFDEEPPCDEFIAFGQTVLDRKDTPGSRELALSYEHNGEKWLQTFFWAQSHAGPVVVKAQWQASSSTRLLDVARQVHASLR